MKQQVQWKALIVSILIPLAVGALSSFLTKDSTAIYSSLIKPPGAPPGNIFPIVWTILYVLMGISSYLIYTAKGIGAEGLRTASLWVYAIQLFVNFEWSIIFFNKQDFLFAFLWLVLLWILIAVMMLLFVSISEKAAWLQAPYLMWVSYAGYLNFGIYLLN